MWRDALLLARRTCASSCAQRWRSIRLYRSRWSCSCCSVLRLARTIDVADDDRGLFWVVVLFSTVLAVQRSFAIESNDGARDGLRLSGLDPGGIFVGKACGRGCELLVLEVVLALVAALCTTPSLGGHVLVGGDLLSRRSASRRSASSTVRFRRDTSARDPVAVVVLSRRCAGSAGRDERLEGGSWRDPCTSGLRWFGLLAVFAVAYVAIGTVVIRATVGGRMTVTAPRADGPDARDPAEHEAARNSSVVGRLSASSPVIGIGGTRSDRHGVARSVGHTTRPLHGQPRPPVYIHPPMAWVAFVAYGVSFLSSLCYLWPRTAARRFSIASPVHRQRSVWSSPG